MTSIIDNFTEEEFIKIVSNSFSYKECLKQMGYNSSSGSLYKMLKQRINKLNLSTAHFKTKKSIVRSPENIFIKNSTAVQKVVRSWYEKGKYSDYKCSICDQQPFWNGKPLIMILDHINGDNKDDRLENLRWVCPNCNYQLDTTNGKNKKHQQHSLNHCVDCGKLISKNAIRCIKCNAQQKIQPLEQMVVNREELKSMIRNMSFVQIGKHFNVSDNAIRKWCDKYHLPRKTTEIRKYTDEEWEKI